MLGILDLILTIMKSHKVIRIKERQELIFYKNNIWGQFVEQTWGDIIRQRMSGWDVVFD